MFACRIVRGGKLRNWPILLEMLKRSSSSLSLRPRIFRIFYLLCFIAIDTVVSLFLVEFSPGLEEWEKILFIFLDDTIPKCKQG